MFSITIRHRRFSCESHFLGTTHTAELYGESDMEIDSFFSNFLDCSITTLFSYGKKLFGESLFKTIKNYSHYSPMLNWGTIGGTIEIKRRKLLKCSNYSPMLNYICRRRHVYLK